jgi:hypothetical protein
MSEDRVPYVPTDKALVLTLLGRVEELENMLRNVDRHSLDLYLYSQSCQGKPDDVAWDIILHLIREIRDCYGPRHSDR